MKKLMGDNVAVPTAAQIKKAIEGAPSKSKKMIALFELGLEVKEIQAELEKHFQEPLRYNFVYNVVSNYCNVNGIKTEAKDKENKKEKIIEMFLAGKTNKEISIELASNYNYVFQTIKAFKQKNPGKVPASETIQEAAAE